MGLSISFDVEPYFIETPSSLAWPSLNLTTNFTFTNETKKFHLSRKFIENWNICITKSSTDFFKKNGLTSIAVNFNHRRGEMMMVMTTNDFNVALSGRCLVELSNNLRGRWCAMWKTEIFAERGLWWWGWWCPCWWLALILSFEEFICLAFSQPLFLCTSVFEPSPHQILTEEDHRGNSFDAIRSHIWRLAVI